MQSHLLYLCGSVLFSLPFFIIVALLLHSVLRRARWKRNQRLGRANSGFCPSGVAIGSMLLFLQVFYRPSLQHTIEVRQRVDVEEDDSGDPDSPNGYFAAQLRKIRWGERVQRLVWRQ
jgi:hypothetical protein